MNEMNNNDNPEGLPSVGELVIDAIAQMGLVTVDPESGVFVWSKSAAEQLDAVVECCVGVNAQVANRLLFMDRETGEELRPVDKVFVWDGAEILDVANMDGSRKWRLSLRVTRVGVD